MRALCLLLEHLDGAVELIQLRLELLHRLQVAEGKSAVLVSVGTDAVALHRHAVPLAEQLGRRLVLGRPGSVDLAVIEQDAAVKVVGDRQVIVREEQQTLHQLRGCFCDVLGHHALVLGQRVAVGQKHPEVLATVVSEVHLDLLVAVLAHEDALGDAARKRHVLGVGCGVAPDAGAALSHGVEVSIPVAGRMSEIVVIDECRPEVGVAFDGMEVDATDVSNGVFRAEVASEVLAENALDEVLIDGDVDARDVVGQHADSAGSVGLLHHHRLTSCVVNVLDEPGEVSGSCGRRGRDEGRQVAAVAGGVVEGHGFEILVLVGKAQLV